MAKKITELTELTTYATNDLLVIEDVSTSTTKKITWANLVANASITPNKLALGAAYATVATSQGTTSLSYVDLATAGPAVTVTIGSNGLALVIISAEFVQSVANDYADMSFAISGATTRAAGAPYHVFYQAYANSSNHRGSNSVLVTGLTPGSTTFTCKYRAIVGGTATFLNREISVLPL